MSVQFFTFLQLTVWSEFFFLFRFSSVMPLTKDEMYAAGIPPEEMGFCAGVLLKYRTCVHNNRPWFTNCIHEKHDYLHCKSEE